VLHADTRAAILGSLVGTAVGDALGLPYEGLSPRRARRLLRGPIRMRLVAGRGMVSDDTEHAVMTARALARSGGQTVAFGAALGSQLRLWFLMMPVALGVATLRACARLCVGIDPERSGVFSAGNGPLMRAPMIGAAATTPAKLRALVERSTRTTHTDPKATRAAILIALAAWIQRRSLVGDEAADLGRALWSLAEPELSADPDLAARVSRACESAIRGESTSAFVAEEGQSRGVSGYCHDTAPACIHAWLSHRRDPLAAAEAVIRAGGDADTTAAITGGIVGAAGVTPATSDAARRIVEWPWTLGHIEQIADAAAEAIARGEARDPGPVFAAARLVRNVCFLVLVLMHGLRRLLPPY